MPSRRNTPQQAGEFPRGCTIDEDDIPSIVHDDVDAHRDVGDPECLVLVLLHSTVIVAQACSPARVPVP